MAGVQQIEAAIGEADAPATLAPAFGLLRRLLPGQTVAFIPIRSVAPHPKCGKSKP